MVVAPTVDSLIVVDRSVVLHGITERPRQLVVRWLGERSTTVWLLSHRSRQLKSNHHL